MLACSHHGHITECTVPSVNPNVITDLGCRNSGPEPEVGASFKGLPQGPASPSHALPPKGSTAFKVMAQAGDWASNSRACEGH